MSNRWVSGEMTQIDRKTRVGRQNIILEQEVPDTVRSLFDFDSQELRPFGKRGLKRFYIKRLCSSCKRECWPAVSEVRRWNGGSGLCRSCYRKDVILQRNKQLRGELSPKWRGGRMHNGKGYISILSPEHPRANKNGYVLEHRLVMEKQIGRYLEPWEEVHHINGRRDDNRPENLELWKKSQPAGVRSADYHCPGCQCEK